MIRVALFLIGCLCLSTNLAIGQKLKPIDLVKDQTNFTSFELLTLDDKRSVSVPTQLHDYTVLALKQQSLKQLAETPADYLQLSLPTNRKPIHLQLAKVDINIDGDYVVTQPAGSLVKVNAGVHYRGIIKGDEQSVVALSIYKDEVMGLISSAETGNKVLGKLEDTDRHILYNDENIASLYSFECSTEDHGIQYKAEELKGHHHGERSLNDCVKLYLEVDYDIYQKKGGLTQTTNHITGLYNQVATLYANENIKTSLQPLNIWTQPSPYNANKSVDMLTKFGQTRTTFNGDLAMLLSYKASGGIAYVDALCNNVPRYRMGFASINENYNNVPTYSWSVMVVTHEFGHLLGSQHTHACAWNGNNTAIDGCYEIEGNCGNPGLPTDGGTIMSYCHLSPVGIKLANGFGTQPGNVIRNRVSNATCTTACADDNGNDSSDDGGSSCSDTEVVLQLTFDNYPAETSWKLFNSDGESVDGGASYTAKNGTITKKFCLKDGCYQFKIFDTYGDGICCSYGNGSYKLTKGNEVLAEGGQFGNDETKSFCIGNTEQKPTCTDGVQNGEETGVDCGGPSCAPCKTGCTQNEYTLELKFDNYPRETNWSIVTPNGDELAKGGNYTTANGSASEKLCLPEGCFDFIITDTYGDGICCSYGNGSFTLKDSDGSIVFTGGQFAKSKTERFCVGGAVDGGDDNDTPTCDDGIQNGDETSIDCGGSCQPCDTGGDGDTGNESTTLLAGHYFESGWDSWADGGSDCYRYSGPFAKEGSYAIRLRDNSGVGSSMTSAAFDLSSYNAVEVRFHFYPYSMEAGEDFFLKYFDGSSWQTVSSFVSGTHFQNGQFHEGAVTITNSNNAFPTNAKFRFQCDASNNGDQIYIDAVQITASSSSSIVQDNTEVQATGTPAAQTITDKEILQITPNPTMGNVDITISSDATYTTTISVIDILGRELLSKESRIYQGSNTIMIETEALPRGTYLLHTRDEENEILVKKFVKL